MKIELISVYVPKVGDPITTLIKSYTSEVIPLKDDVLVEEDGIVYLVQKRILRMSLGLITVVVEKIT